MTTFILAIIVFAVIVVIHELGHFIIAKISGIKVEEFAVGMGPKLVSVKKGETVYSLRALPLGGYCKMMGEDEQNNDIRAFNNKSVFTRIAVILFGPLMNFILAVIIFSLIVVQIPVISEVIPGKPAEKAGIIKGDKIVEINSNKITSWEQVKYYISKEVNKELNIIVENKGQKRNIKVTPIIDKESGDAIIGIRPLIAVAGVSLKEGLQLTLNVSYAMIDYLANLLQGEASTDEVSGPVGIIVFINEAAKVGFLYVLNLTAFLSLNLGIINLLPIPALDGGRLVFLLIEAIRRKPINPEKEGFVHFIGFVLLMTLAIIIAYRDLIKFNILNMFR